MGEESRKPAPLNPERYLSRLELSNIFGTSRFGLRSIGVHVDARVPLSGVVDFARGYIDQGKITKPLGEIAASAEELCRQLMPDQVTALRDHFAGTLEKPDSPAPKSEVL